jgi:hypothetical protein
MELCRQTRYVSSHGENFISISKDLWLVGKLACGAFRLVTDSDIFNILCWIPKLIMYR